MNTLQILVAYLLALNLAWTPGMVRYLSPSQVCSTRWGLDRRHVTEKMKREVARRYGVAWETRAEYEFDHLVPRELGGADDVRNLWPQALKGQWNARMKDRLENRLHVLVCAGKLSLAEAQEAIRMDWRAAYVKWVQP
jgi:hypothetical protein